MLGRDNAAFEEEEDAWNDDLLEEFPVIAAAIIPRPNVNQIIYHGALGARYKQRKKVVG